MNTQPLLSCTSARGRLAGDFLRDPAQAVVEAIAGDGTRGLDVPVVVLYAVEREGIGDLRGCHGVLQVLLIREHQDHRALQVRVLQQPEQLVLDDVDPGAVRAVDHHDHGVCSPVVRRPRSAQAFLPS
jgi:hypothetical protein|uniref:Uncharacterized protein n=1 Tax=Zea mays TaxID=4577 RepID=C0HH36_MAIZE|nr:unknown [Zea mays]